MGEVYRARDKRLGRTVAIKVLPTELSTRADLRDRFEREARVISNLSHPHICALYDVGNQDGVEFLVMEFLEGETLAERLERGPIPYEQMLRYGIEIAEALEWAHRAGVVHRDLKPGNIMLTRSGAKLLDFGLAKLRPMESALYVSNIQSSPTGAGNLSMAGTIVGTVQYMAPEQLEGKDADSRADIFAFGTVLYEMATGKRAFEGGSYASVIAAIMSSQPAPISTVLKVTPAALDRVVGKCLAKDPDERWHSAHDLAAELRWILEGGTQSSAVLLPMPSAHWVGRIKRALPALLLAIITALAVIVVLARKPRSVLPLVKLSIVHAAQTAASGPIALSPDGKKVAMAATGTDGGKLLWIRDLQSLEPKSLPATDDAVYPFWSPDGRFLAFFTQDKLKRMEVGGGPPQTLADAPGGKGGSWNKDGVILLSPTFTGGIFRMQATGGAMTPLTNLDASRQESSHRWPWFLPDGIHFLYVILAAQRENCGIYAGSIADSHLKKQLTIDYSRVEYASPGYLIFIRGRTLTAQRFDADKLELQGDAYSLGEKAGYDGYSGYGAFSSAGNVLTFGSLDEPKKHLVLRSRDGKELSSHGTPADYREPAVSPDGKRVVVERRDPATDNNDLWIVELTRDTFTRFTFDPSNEVSALWSPDGTRIVFCSNPKGLINIYQKDLSSGTQTLLVDSPDPKYPDDWSQDGKYILFDELASKTKFDIKYFSPDGKQQPQTFLETPFNETHARFSPDVNWIAYTSDETGRAEVYARRFPPQSNEKWQISTNGGDQAFWSRDGSEIYYLSAERKLMAVVVTTGATLDAGVPVLVTAAAVDPNTLVDDRNQYAPAPDGKSFLITERVAKSEVSPVSIILNWPALLHD